MAAAQALPLWWRMGEGWLPRHWPYAIAMAACAHMVVGGWWMHRMLQEATPPTPTVIEFNLSSGGTIAAAKDPSATLTEPASITASLSAPVPQTKPDAAPLEVVEPENVQPTDAMLRYEQQLSGWIQQHRTYPAEAESKGLKGHAVLRIRIDRQGGLQQAALEVSSGHTLLDDAALAMVRQASPLPAVPDTYPKAEFLDFLVPVQFR